MLQVNILVCDEAFEVALVEQAAAAAAASLEQQAHELVGAISIFNVAQNTAKHPATIVQLNDKRTAEKTGLTERSNLHNSNNHLNKRSKIAVGDHSDQWSKF